MSISLPLTIQRGCITMKCDQLAHLFTSFKKYVPDSAIKSKDSRDGANSFHLTVTTPNETSQLLSNAVNLSLPDISDVVFLGLSHIRYNESESWSVVVLCPSLQKFRANHGLHEKDFHITLGFHTSDPHAPTSSYLIQSIEQWTENEILDLQWHNLQQHRSELDSVLTDDAFPLVKLQTQALLERLFEHYSNNSQNGILIENIKDLGKVAMAGQCSILCGDIGWFLLQKGFLLGLRLVLTSMLQLNSRIDIMQLKNNFPVDITNTVNTMNRDKLHKNIVDLNKLMLAHSHQPFDKFLVFIQKDETSLQLACLPRNFSWVELPSKPAGYEGDVSTADIDKYLLAGCAYPGNTDQMLAIYFVGIRRIITIHEGPLSSRFQISSTALGKNSSKELPPNAAPLLHFTHIQCNDRTPPSRRQVENQVIPVMYEHIAKKEGVLIHCLGGLGRTNTLIIAYLMVWKQISSSVATEEVTRQRRIILSESQKGFLREWYRVVSSGFSISSLTVESTETKGCVSSAVAASTSSLPVPIQETLLPSLSLKEYQKIAHVNKMPPIILLCGLPASGKSTFAKALVAAQPKFFVRVNRDEMRGKGEVDRALSNALQPYLKSLNTNSGRGAKSLSVSQCIVIDNCHVNTSKRREWLDAVHRLPTWCVYFDRPVELCKIRISQRTDHPTIPAGPAGLPIIDSMFRQWQPPTAEEGFTQIFRIQSDEDMMQLLQTWKIPFQPPRCACPEPEITARETEQANGINDGAENVDDSNEEDEEEAGNNTVSSVFEGDKPIKFPRTAHAMNLGAATRDDKILPASDLQNWISNRRHLLIEEKVDGANIGFHIRGSDNRIIAQNRSHYISSSYHPQFALLDKWIAKHTEDLWEILEPDRHILYGEWMYATHSVYYGSLPDFFIAYDLYDVQTKSFLSRRELASRLSRTKLVQVPLVYEGIVESQDHLRSFVNGESEFGAPRREGIVIRLCDGDKVVARAKLVRPDFIAGNERWNRSSKLQTNELRKVSNVDV